MKYTPEQVDSACFTWRHDFGIISEPERAQLRKNMAQVLEHLPDPANSDRAAFDFLTVCSGLISRGATHVRVGDVEATFAERRVPGPVRFTADELQALADAQESNFHWSSFAIGLNALAEKKERGQ